MHFVEQSTNNYRIKLHRATCHRTERHDSVFCQLIWRHLKVMTFSKVYTIRARVVIRAQATMHELQYYMLRDKCELSINICYNLIDSSRTTARTMPHCLPAREFIERLETCHFTISSPPIIITWRDTISLLFSAVGERKYTLFFDDTLSACARL